MSEYLRIENFGPIDEVILDDIRPLTVFIGESGSGKSTIMKVLSLFRWMYKRVNLRSYLQHAGIKKTRIGFKIQNLMKTSGIVEYLKQDSVIVYRRGDYEIRMVNKSVNIRFTIAPEDLCLDKLCFISDKRSMISDFLDNKMERRIANYYLQDTMDNFLEACESIKVLPLDYLDVKFKVEKPKTAPMRYRIQSGDEDFTIDMKNASSGMQTVTPLSMIIEYFATCFDSEVSMNSSLFKFMTDTDNLKQFRSEMNVGEIKNRNVHVFIEEPELSLYPESQKSLMDFLVDRCFHKNHDYNMTLMIATHSPYIVNYLNLLIKRSEAGGDTPYKMAFEDVNAYEICGGTANSLRIDGEHRIINATSLSDPISRIYSEYNAI